MADGSTLDTGRGVLMLRKGSIMENGIHVTGLTVAPHVDGVRVTSHGPGHSASVVLAPAVALRVAAAFKSASEDGGALRGQGGTLTVWPGGVLSLGQHESEPLAPAEVDQIVAALRFHGAK